MDMIQNVNCPKGSTLLILRFMTGRGVCVFVGNFLNPATKHSGKFLNCTIAGLELSEHVYIYTDIHNINTNSTIIYCKDESTRCTDSFVF